MIRSAVIRSGCSGDVGTVTIDRHDRRNALDVEHCDAIREHAAGLVDAGVRALVVTGAGSSFCAGADLGEVYGADLRRALYAMLGWLSHAPVPVVAAVNGPAIGAGTQLALACDLRVASPTARFAVPTARQGLAVDPWTVSRLAAIAGGGTARAMLLGGRELDATLALARGLVDLVGGGDDALAWAHEIATFSPVSLRYTKAALAGGWEPGGEDLRAAFELCWESADCREARLARQEGRLARFEGR